MREHGNISVTNQTLGGDIFKSKRQAKAETLLLLFMRRLMWLQKTAGDSVSTT